MCFAPQRRALFRHLKAWRGLEGGLKGAWRGGLKGGLEGGGLRGGLVGGAWRGGLEGGSSCRSSSSSSSSSSSVFCTCWLPNVLRATTACTFSTSQIPKVLRSWGVLHILTWKCASRHNGVHFFDISTSKSGPRMVCFVHFDFEMCFAPQRRAIFHLSSGQLAPPPPL